MRVGNDIKGKVNGQVILTVEEIDLLLSTIRVYSEHFWLLAAARLATEVLGFPPGRLEPALLLGVELMDLKSLEVMEKQLEFMKKEMQDEHSKKA